MAAMSAGFTRKFNGMRHLRRSIPGRVPQLAVALLLSLSLLAAALAGELYVYYPSTVRPQVFQKKLSAECHGMQVLVFGRYQDFMARVEIDTPTAIMANPNVISQCANYAVHLEGLKGDSLNEPYVLLWVGAQAGSPLQAATDVGIVNMLGRKQTEDFARGAFSSNPKVQIVTKVEDLLPLLIFEMVKGVIIPARQVDYFKETSQLKFSITPLPAARVGIVGLGIRQGVPAADIEKSVLFRRNPGDWLRGQDYHPQPFPLAFRRAVVTGVEAMRGSPCRPSSFRRALSVAILSLALGGVAGKPAAAAQSILDSTATPAYNNLDQVIDKADCILLAVKDEPFRSVKKLYVDSLKKYPPYLRTTYHFTVLSSIKSIPGVPSVKKLDVRDGYEDLAWRTHSLYYQRHMTMQSILQVYRPSITLNRRDTLLVFLNYAPPKDPATSMGSFFFAVRNAYEAAALKDSVVSTMQRLKRPIPMNKRFVKQWEQH